MENKTRCFDCDAPGAKYARVHHDAITGLPQTVDVCVRCWKRSLGFPV